MSLPSLLSHYPILESLIPNLDQTDLHHLTFTNRTIFNLIHPILPTLLPQTLRCQFADGKPQCITNSTDQSVESLRCAYLDGQKHAKERQGITCVSDVVHPCHRCQQPTCRTCNRYARLDMFSPLGSLRLRNLCSACTSTPAPPNPSPHRCTCTTSIAWKCIPCLSLFYRRNHTYNTYSSQSRTAISCAMASTKQDCPGWDLSTPLGSKNAARLRSFAHIRYLQTLGHSYRGPTGLAGNKRKVDEALRKKMVEEDLESGKIRIRMVDMRMDTSSNDLEKMEVYNAFVDAGGDVGWTVGRHGQLSGRKLCDWCFGLVEEGSDDWHGNVPEKDPDL